MAQKTIIIDGNNFSDLETFYCEIDKLFTKNIDWKTGHNLNAFNDLLCGGFGIYESDEQVKICWVNFKKSEEELGRELMTTLVEIINGHQHIGFSIQY